nr:hypothetical transcript [Hymenolepis microstoma]
MDPREGLNDIYDFLHKPLARQLFAVTRIENTFAHLNILTGSGGFITIITDPVESLGSTGCLLLVNGLSPSYCRLLRRVQVGSVRQAFIGCLFLLTQHLGLEMPVDFVECDPNFYRQLPAKIISYKIWKKPTGV